MRCLAPTSSADHLPSPRRPGLGHVSRSGSAGRSCPPTGFCSGRQPGSAIASKTINHEHIALPFAEAVVACALAAVTAPAAHAVQAAGGRSAQPVAEDDHPEEPVRRTASASLRPHGSHRRRGYGELHRCPSSVGPTRPCKSLRVQWKTLRMQKSASASHPFLTRSFLNVSPRPYPS